MVIERLQLSVCLSRSGRLFHTQRPPFAAAGGRKRLRYLLERTPHPLNVAVRPVACGNVRETRFCIVHAHCCTSRRSYCFFPAFTSKIRQILFRDIKKLPCGITQLCLTPKRGHYRPADLKFSDSEKLYPYRRAAKMNGRIGKKGKVITLLELCDHIVKALLHNVQPLGGCGAQISAGNIPQPRAGGGKHEHHIFQV